MPIVHNVTGYWCRFVAEGGHVVAGEKLEAADDAAAIEKARRIFPAGLATRYELWDAKRLVYREQVK